jgi:putative two-component system response regulator
MSLRPLDEPLVLVVEDDESVGRLAARTLASGGYPCLMARDTTEAGELLDKAEPELVLCDVNLPGASGLVLARHVVAEHPETAVVMVSGLDDPDVAGAALTLGAYGYIVKPFTPNELLIGAANALRRRRLEIESRARRDELEQLVRARTAALRRSHEETIRRLAWAAEFRDEETGRHIERMSRLCDLLAARAGLGDDRRELLRSASPLHDVGKIGIPDSILLKPGSLSPAEWKVMRTHPQIGHRLLSGSGAELLDLAALIALTHHERIDGTGYPHGLAGEEIPLEGRIAAVADVFDALTSDRVYRPALTLDEALAVLREGRGTHFDARLLDLFLDAIDEVVVIVAASPASAPNRPPTPARASL